MTIATSLRQLETQRRQLDEALCALQVTLSEDRPFGAVPALVDRFENVATELHGIATDLGERIDRLQQEHSIDADRMREIHELMHSFARCYWHEFARYAPLRELLHMGDERGRAWQAWTQVVRSAVESCEAPFDRANSALIECWSWLADRRVAHGPAASLAKLRVVGAAAEAPHQPVDE
jgi:hypothetical protein